MPQVFYFITHPNVVVSREVPVPRWPLSELGCARMRAGLHQPWVAGLRAVFCSTEQKALDGAQILAAHLALEVSTLDGLGENDRSATGFLPPAEFEQVADEFFARPLVSVRGWECAADAQARVVGAVEQVARSVGDVGPVAIVSHGAVGTLLYCHLAGLDIARRWDQGSNGGGNYFAFTLQPRRALGWWKPFDDCAPPAEASHQVAGR